VKALLIEKVKMVYCLHKVVPDDFPTSLEKHTNISIRAWAFSIGEFRIADKTSRSEKGTSRCFQPETRFEG
jgi:hypothetical protein